MDNLIGKHYFPGGNSSKGFYSFYRYILSQDDASRILCLKGGPGTGKSSLMKKVAQYFLNKGYSIEYHHCSSDNNSLDGIVIKELNVAIVDGTSPHIVDPITPGAVDEIINMGDALDIDMLSKHKKEILSINKDISKCYKRAYRYLAAAKCIHDDWSNLHYESLDSSKVSVLIETLKNDIFRFDKTGYGNERHLFATAITPDGIITYVDTLFENYKNKYVLTGGPGLSKTNILDALGNTAQKKGYSVEYMHDPFMPERLEHIFIPELSTCILTNNEINKSNFDGVSYNLLDYTNQTSLTKRLPEIEYNSKLFDDLVSKAISLISNSHARHDDLEVFYIAAMNFDVVNAIYDKIIKKIERYE